MNSSYFQAGPDKSASVYECFPFIWPYNALIGQVAARNLGRVLLQAISMCQALRLFLRCFGIVFHFAFENDFCFGPKALVVGELDDLPHMYIAGAEVQCIFSANISWEPVLPVNLLAIRHKFGREVLLNISFLFRLYCLRHGLAAALHNLENPAIHPDASLEIALAF